MSRSSQSGRWFLLLSALTAALWLASAPAGRAATYTYAARQRTVNAGVLFVGSAGDPVGASDPAPYIFYVLNQRADMKPVGWNIVNPIAPNLITSAQRSRWGTSYALGRQVQPDMAAYWEVPLRDTSADQLQQFDVLYLHASYKVGTATYAAQFTPADNEKLRRFVDNGGQLFIEYGDAGGTLPFFGDAAWVNGADPNLAPPPLSAAPQHPLVSQPNGLGTEDFLLLGSPSDTGVYGVLQPGTGVNDYLGEYNNLFSPVLYRYTTAQAITNPAVSAAQLGAGQITVSAAEIGRAVTLSTGSFFTTTAAPQNPDAAPSGNLKFLSNLISWADTHPTENKTGHQNASGPSAASFTAAWSYPDPSLGQAASGTTPPAAAVWGSFIFATCSDGVLRAFDAYPDEFLTGLPVGAPNFDDGIPDFSGASPTPYDRLWEVSVGSGASGPTLGSYQGTTYVFVELPNGNVVAYNALDKTLYKTLAPPTPINASFTGVNAPAPTYYEGRIYAGQADGSLLVYDLNAGASAGNGAVLPLNATTDAGEVTTASPAVGLLAAGDTNDAVVAHVATSQNMYTVLLGGRNDPLVAYTTNGQILGYNVNRGGRYFLNNLFVDTASVPPARAYGSDGFGPGGSPNSPLSASAGQDPVFSAASTDNGALFGDWDVDFVQSITPANASPTGQTLTLHSIKALSIDNSNSADIQATLSAPAFDRKGDYYYTVNDGTNSYLFGVHDDLTRNGTHIKFRFRMPTAGDLGTWNGVDADNVNYNDATVNKNQVANSLLGFKFVGAPVADGQGNVYVAASNGTVAAVLCFNADQAVSLDGGLNFDATAMTYTQKDESSGGDNTLQVSLNLNNTVRAGQASVAGSRVTIFNFGAPSRSGVTQIAGNVSEPQPVTATPNTTAGSGSPITLDFNTNLAWYVTFPVNGAISGLSKAGNTLMLADSAATSGSSNTLYKLSAAPTVGAGKVANIIPVKSALGTGTGGKPLNIGAVSAAPSAGGGAMVVNGAAGLAAFTQQLTLIADNNRILETDADGAAVWSADATTRDIGDGTATKVDFAHPTWLSQFAPNDYLVADTGNNRCVRFDRAGKVRWELTRFYDPGGLMAPGQPLTLNQPASVEVRREPFLYLFNGTNFVGSSVHYLVADSGNNRIVEVTDTLDPFGNALYFDTNTPANVVAPGTAGAVTHDHLLSWVTHTGDLSGRRYRYGAASYLDIPGPTAGAAHTIEVFALVTNTRLAPLALANGQLASASADAPGGSIVAFNRPVAPQSFSALTHPAANTTAPNDLLYIATSFTARPTAAASVLTFPVRNPRFLHVFAPPQSAPANPSLYAYSFLYADDNGAFDLVFQPPAANGQPTPPASYGLAFTQQDYQNMSQTYSISADIPSNVPARTGSAGNGATPAVPPIPFVPSCVQRLNDDDTNILGTKHITRYLITQSFGQSELGGPPTAALPYKIGGEVFEVDVVSDSAAAPPIQNIPVGGFAGGVTLSRPVSTTPLTQPASAIRTTQ